LAKSGLIPNFTVTDALAAIKKAFPEAKAPVTSQKPK
jgi:hypothetical protein